MDKKEMQNWIDYLNNGGNALDMFDELERKAEEKRREKDLYSLDSGDYRHRCGCGRSCLCSISLSDSGLSGRF